MAFLVISNVFGMLLFIYLFWRRLKEDYSSDIIFSTALTTLLGLGVALFIALYVFPKYWFWITFVGASIGMLVGVVKYNLRIYEVIEGMVISLLPWLGLVYLVMAVSSRSAIMLVGFAIVLLCLVIYGVLNKYYRGFSWYKSGKVGFAGITTLGVYFLARAVVAIASSDMLSFIGKYEVVVSALATFVCFAALFRLSKKAV